MSDNKSKTGKADDSRINVNEAYELQYWAEKFNVSTAKLKQAVNEVGPMVANVQDYLQSNSK